MRGETTLDDGRAACVFSFGADAKMLVPASMEVDSVVRPLVDRDRAYRLLAQVGETAHELPEDWETRYRMQMELLKRGSTEDNIQVMEMSLAEAKAEPNADSAFTALVRFKKAKTLVVAELAAALERPEGDVKKEIEEMLD